MHVRSSETGVILVSMCGLHQHGWKEAEHGSHVEEIDEKMRMLTNPHHFLTMSIWDVLSVCANRMKQLLNSMRTCLSHEFSAGATEKLTGCENFTRKPLCGPTTWKDMLKNALSDTVNWQTRKWSNCTKFQVPAWMIIMSGRKKSNQLENCQKFAHKLS